MCKFIYTAELVEVTFLYILQVGNQDRQLTSGTAIALDKIV